MTPIAKTEEQRELYKLMIHTLWSTCLSNFNEFDFFNELELKFEDLGFRQSPKKLDKNFDGNILIIRTDVIGDFILTSSFIRELRKNVPRAKITLICSPIAYELAEYCPYIDEIHVYRGSTVNKIINTILVDLLPFIYDNLWFDESGNKIIYDYAFLPQYGSDSFLSILIGYLSGAQRRVGYGLHPFYSYIMREDNTMQTELFDTSNLIVKDYKNYIDNFLLTNAIDISSQDICHEVDKHLYLLQEIGLDITNKNLELWLDETVDLNIDKNKIIIAVGLGAGKNYCVYDIKKYEQALKQIYKSNDIEIVLLGGFEERTYNIDVPTTNLINKLSLRESADVIRQSDIYIGNDSALVHMAAALMKPVILLHREAKNYVTKYKQLLSAVDRFRPYYGSNENKSIILQPEAPSTICAKLPIAHGVCKGTCNNQCINSIDYHLIIQAFDTLKEKYLQNKAYVSS